MAIELTEQAAQEVKTIMGQQNRSAETTYLRLGVKGGGCGGFSYSLDLTAHKSERDQEFESQGIKIICDSRSYRYIDGVILEFRNESTGAGFVFNNPNTQRTCGCGGSFSI